MGTKEDDLLKELLALSAAPQDTVDVGRLNKVKELLGEAGAEQKLAETFGPGRLKDVSVPRRGEKGAQILDLLYELDNGQLVLVESKYGTSQFGRTTDRHVFLVTEKAERIPVPLKRQVTQLDSLWIKDRILEIEKKDPVLAKRLREAIEKQELHVLEVRTNVVVDNAGGGRLVSDVTDHTQRIKAQTKSGARFTDDERRYARREGLSDLNLQRSEAKAAEAKTAAKDAERRAKSADRKVARAQKAVDKANGNPKSRQTTREKRATELADAQKEAAELRAEARQTQEAAQKAEEIRKFNAKERQLETTLRKREEARKRLDRGLPAAADGPSTARAASKEGAEVANTAADARKAGTTAVDTVHPNRMIEARGLGDATATSLAARGAGHEIADVAAKAPRRAIFELAARGTRVAVRAARVVFTVLDFANPIFDLLMAVDIVDAIVRWLDRDRIEEQQEWVRLTEFLFGPTDTITNVFGVRYQTSIRGAINSILEYQLASDTNTGNFLVWLTKWNSKKWKGFVYTQVDIPLQRQKENNDERYAVKYYWDGAPVLTFVDVPRPNARTETSGGGSVGATDARNRSTLGAPAVYDPEHNIAVDISNLQVRITHPAPTLTPFDFIIVKCRHLVSEIVTFVSAYDDTIIDGMEIRQEILDNVKINWLALHPFPAPLNAPQIDFCLTSIFRIIDALEQHRPMAGDFGKRGRLDKFNFGYYRRVGILRKVNAPQTVLKGKRLMWEVVLQMRLLATPTKRTAGMVADLDYLGELANNIDDDLQRTFKASQSLPTSLEYNYQGVEPPKRN